MFYNCFASFQFPRVQIFQILKIHFLLGLLEVLYLDNKKTFLKKISFPVCFMSLQTQYKPRQFPIGNTLRDSRDESTFSWVASDKALFPVAMSLQ